MFTGIVTTVGTAVKATPRGGDLRLTVDAGSMSLHDIALGESICVSGVCLTVVAWDAATFTVDVSRETLTCTTMADIAVGTSVNLERALTPDTRLGGHFVTGHVDGVGVVAALTEDARSWRLGIAMPQPVAPFVASKGSVTIDGVSLTVNTVDEHVFEVNIVPHTMEVTTMQRMQVGDRVNIEVDLLARYVARLRQFERAGN